MIRVECLFVIVMDWIVFPTTSYVEVQTPSVTVFGERALRMYLRLNEAIKWG